MKASLGYFLVFSFSIFLVDCAPAQDYSQVKIVESRSAFNPDGSYEFKYVLDNGVSHSAVGTLKEINGENVIVATGSYSFNSPDGQRFVVEYVADENGYRVTSGEEKHVGIVAYINPKLLGSLVG